MANSVLIPYRGDLTTARLNFKNAKKQQLKKFKRDLLKVWDLSDRVLLWSNQQGYLNDKVRKLFGIEKNFMKKPGKLYGFGLVLKASANVDKVIALSEEQKDYLRGKCLAIFNKYGHTVKSKYVDGAFEFQTFKDGIETEFDGQEDEELAGILYDRITMYMVNNDSSDTIDNWSNYYENETDFFNSSMASKLKSFTYTFTNAQILKMVNDRLFTKRNYTSLNTNRFSSVVKGVDTVLFNELLDNGSTDNVDGRYWTWDGTQYNLNINAVANLPAEEFMIFIQTHIGTFYSKPKKKWYQSGVFGVIFIVLVVAVAILTQQYWLIGVSIGTTLVVAGMIISITGALIGNKVMVVGGQIVGLVGGGMNLVNALSADIARMEAADALMAKATEVGADNVAIQKIANDVITDMMIDSALGVGNFALSSYTTINNLLGDTTLDTQTTTQLPEDKINEIYVADDMSWDYVQRFLPDFFMANALRII